MAGCVERTNLRSGMADVDLLALEKVVKVVHRLIDTRELVRPASLEDSLAEAGLTSLDSVKLVIEVENEFDLEIPVGELTLVNFRSISTISQLIARLLEQT
jgi:acyl carrier protein